MRNVFFLIMFSFSLQGYAQLQLQNIYDTIQKNNPSLKMFDADIRALDETAKGAGSWMPPEFAAGFWMTPYQPKYWKVDNLGQPGMGQFMLSAQQMFPNKTKQEAEAKYMKTMSSVEKEKKDALLNDLYAEAKKNYYDWIILEKKLSVITEDVKLLDFMIQNAEIRYKNGTEKLSAYYKAKAALGNAENMRLMLQNEIAQKRIRLNTLMNRDKNVLFLIDTIYQIKDYAGSFDSTRFVNARSDIKSIDRSIQLTFLQQSLERAKLKPEFGIRYDHMFAWARQPWQFSLMGMVKIPLGGSTRMQKANIEGLNWQAESYRQQRQMLINDATGIAQGMITELATKQKQLRLYENNIIPALRNNYKTMQLGYEQNTEELFMLFDAWETLYMTQLDYLDQLLQLLQLQTELDRVLQVK